MGYPDLKDPTPAGRKRWPKGKRGAEQTWPPQLYVCCTIKLHGKYPPFHILGKLRFWMVQIYFRYRNMWLTSSGGFYHFKPRDLEKQSDPYWRNKYVREYIFKTTGQTRTRVQVNDRFRLIEKTVTLQNREDYLNL